MSIGEYKKSIDRELKLYFENKIKYSEEEKIIYEAMSYSTNIGGKRIRPILFMATHNIFSNSEVPMGIPCAIEMIHTYSLIHDDLPDMDNDDLRRGKPTNHKVFGNAMAILAGDGLLNEAFNIAFQYVVDHPHHAKALKYLCNSSGVEGMISGQVIDILNENKTVSLKELEKMHRLKTGALIKASIVSGAIIGGATEEEIILLEQYGDALGLAFQVIDDILDVTGNEEKIGKKVGSDETNNKSTFVTLIGLEESKVYAEKLTLKCYDILDKIDKNTDELYEITKYLLNREE